jgi:uncharacterized Zn finger protein (UPF0148 family)
MELDALLRYLNEAKTQEQKRVLAILDQMLSLAKINPPIFDEKIEGPLMSEDGLPNPAFEKVAPEKYWLQMEFERRKTTLNAELAQYAFTPYVLTSVAANQLSVIWRRNAEQPERPDAMTEGQAVELILNLARSGQLMRLRRCGHCQSWLYAKFQHQTFCSMQCQQKVYTQSEEWKAHRRKYMRDYYRLKKTRREKFKRR